ncbi:serine hydrolase domain-containing protein, partial [Bacteroidota bacterium]
YGLANVQAGTVFQSETPCYIGSLSKQFTAMAVMILVERELISLQQHIKDYFPEYPDLWKDVTIHHLLTHQSGISDYLNDHGYAFDGMTNDDAIDYVIKNGYMNFEPGEMWKYSNTGYIILAELVEKVSGKSLSLFCNEEIFSPLGMVNTFYVDDDNQEPNDRAVGHTLSGELFDYTIKTNGDGGVISTVDDMLKWDKSLNTGFLVSRETIADMMSPFADMNNGAYYGYGWYIDNINGFELISHDGGIAGIFAYAGRVKEKDFYVCLFGNSPNYQLYLQEIIITVFDFYFPENINGS